jgi:excisionase family DNA binding protein
MEKIYTLDEIAELLKIAITVVEDLVNSGRLRAMRLGDQVRVWEKDLQLCLEQSAVPADAMVPEEGVRLCHTFGGETQFRVQGSVEKGARIWPGKKAPYPLKCSKEFFEGLLKKHRGQTTRVGLSFSEPGEASLGAYIRRELNTKMNPTTYIAGLLVEEGYAERSERGYIRFFSGQRGRKSAASNGT